MAYIPKTGISNTSTIQAEHITRIIDALDGTAATEVSASGQFSGSHSGSFLGDGSGLTGVTAEWDGTHNGNAQITGSLVVTANVTASGNISSSGNVLAENIFLPSNGIISFDNSQNGTDQLITGVDNQLVIDGDDLIVFKADSGGYEFRNTSNVATVHITTDGAITAAGNISSSGDLYSGDKLYINSKEALEAANALGINEQGDFTSGVTINRVNLPQPITLNGNVTASGKITADGNISGSGNLNVQGTLNANNHNIGFFDGSNINLGYENNTPISIGKSGNPTTVVGNVTASGNISSSGTLIGGGLNVNGGSIANVQSITATNVAVGTILDAATGGDTNIALTGTALNIEVGGETFLETTGTTAKFSTNVTASGNISSSGNITTRNILVTDITVMDDLFVKDNIYSVGADDPSIKLNPGATNFDVEIGDVDGASAETIFKVKESSGSFEFLNGNVTASGNISSSFTSASSGPNGVPSVSGFEIAAHRYITKTQSVAAAGDTQASAAQISPDAGIVFVSSADNTKGVILPLTTLVEIGTTITILNGVSNRSLEVYPTAGEVLLPMLSTNSPATVPAGASIVCVKFSDSRWFATFGGVIS